MKKINNKEIFSFKLNIINEKKNFYLKNSKLFNKIFKNF